LYLLLTLGLWVLLRAGDVYWPATLLMFSPRWLLAFPLALLLPAAALLRRRSLGLLLLTLVLIAGPIMDYNVPWQRFRFDTPQGPRLRVLTCNMHYQASQPVSLEHLLAVTHPDVVAVQEWYETAPSAYFPKNEWHTHEAPDLFLACRGPIRRARRIGQDSMDERGSVMRYELETSAGIITFFSLHLASPRRGLYEVIHEPQRGAEELRAGSALRAEQFENLSLKVEDVSGPLILAGDFNTPPESVLFRDVWGRYTDAFSSAGWGWGYTFLGGRTTVRIDHILAGPGWRCQRCWVGANVGSPHRPVLADLVWMGAPPER
jgi:endonuclease/exonuclease/phosphatase (EEP) superfamily protein YafD